MKTINDLEFQQICALIYDVVFSTKKVEKINIFLSNKYLINLKYENFAHLLGIQYYRYIFPSLNKAYRKDLFKEFIYYGKIGKLKFSSVIKRVYTSWSSIKNHHQFNNVKDKNSLIYNLQSKLICIGVFIDQVVNNKTNSMILFTRENTIIKDFVNFGTLNKNYLIMGCKNIARHEFYEFQTLIPMSFQMWKNLTLDISTQTIENIKIYR